MYLFCITLIVASAEGYGFSSNVSNFKMPPERYFYHSIAAPGYLDSILRSRDRESEIHALLHMATCNIISFIILANASLPYKASILIV